MTRLAAIWRITRADGRQLFFTDHDKDIVFARDTYRAPIGFERTAITASLGSGAPAKVKPSRDRHGTATTIATSFRPAVVRRAPAAAPAFLALALR